jgi:hypothetical protein
VTAFAVAVAVLVAVTVSAARARDHQATAASRSSSRSSSTTPARIKSSPTTSSSGSPSTAGRPAATSTNASPQLAAALAPVLAHRTGGLSVGVIDETTGEWAVYNHTASFHTASIVKADILAALLLRHQAEGAPLTQYEQALAVQMIEASDNDAAQDLWNDDDEADGIADADAQLGLHHTTPAQGGYWGLTTTRVVDQLRLLSDLVSARSPLTAASRSFELGLMRHVEPSQAWGVTKAATPKTVYAVKNGWLPDPQLWVIDSIGVVHHRGHLLLLAVLSNDQPSEAVGVAQAEAAATAAARTITEVRS